MEGTAKDCGFGDIDNKTLLREINKAIHTILFGGQYYRIGSRELRRADLSELYKMKNELDAAAQTEDETGIGRHTAVGFFDRR